MKIAVVTRSFPSLSETFILNQITGLIDRGCEVDIYATKPVHSGVVHEDIERYQVLEKTYYRPRLAVDHVLRLREAALLFSTNFRRAPLALLRSLNFLKYGRRSMSLELLHAAIPFLDRPAYDVIHCHFGETGLIAAHLKDIGLLHSPFITTFHGFDVMVAPQKYQKGFYAPLFRSSDMCTVGSEFMKQRVRELGGDESRLTKLPVGVDLAKYNFTEREAATRPHVRVLTVARLVEAKGVEYALRAIARVIARHQEIHYQIVGDGPLRERLQGLAGELEIADHVSFLGGQSQGRISRLYEEADIFVLPSIIGTDGWQEGQGLVLMEAQATGLPIISTNTGGIPESIRDGETGFLVPERDVDSLAERLCFLIEHRHLRIQMGRAGRAHVEQNYDLNKLNDELVRLYQMVIAQDAKHPVPESTSLRHR